MRAKLTSCGRLKSPRVRQQLRIIWNNSQHYQHYHSCLYHLIIITRSVSLTSTILPHWHCNSNSYHQFTIATSVWQQWPLRTTTGTIKPPTLQQMSNTDSDSLGFIRPPGTISSGRASVSPQMFFFVQRPISDVPRPIATKLCHIIGIWLCFIMQVQKFRERPPPPKKNTGGEKHSKFRSIFCNVRFWLRISPERLKISNS